MKDYNIWIDEVYTHCYNIKANSREEAEEIMEQMLISGEADVVADGDIVDRTWQWEEDIK